MRSTQQSSGSVIACKHVIAQKIWRFSERGIYMWLTAFRPFWEQEWLTGKVNGISHVSTT